MVDVNATLRQGIRDKGGVRRTQSEKSGERFQGDGTVSVHHSWIEIERVELGHEKSDLALAARAQAVLCEALL